MWLIDDKDWYSPLMLLLRKGMSVDDYKKSKMDFMVKSIAKFNNI